MPRAGLDTGLGPYRLKGFVAPYRLLACPSTPPRAMVFYHIPLEPHHPAAGVDVAGVVGLWPNHEGSAIDGTDPDGLAPVVDDGEFGPFRNDGGPSLW